MHHPPVFLMLDIIFLSTDLGKSYVIYSIMQLMGKTEAQRCRILMASMGLEPASPDCQPVPSLWELRQFSLPEYLSFQSLHGSGFWMDTDFEYLKKICSD